MANHLEKWTGKLLALGHFVNPRDRQDWNSNLVSSFVQTSGPLQLRETGNTIHPNIHCQEKL